MRAVRGGALNKPVLLFPLNGCLLGLYPAPLKPRVSSDTKLGFEFAGTIIAQNSLPTSQLSNEILAKNRRDCSPVEVPVDAQMKYEVECSRSAQLALPRACQDDPKTQPCDRLV